jgi:hypothetical protein
MQPIDAAADARAKVIESMRGELGTDAKLKAIISAAIMSGPKVASEPSEAAVHIRAVTRGAMQGFIVLEKDLPAASVQIMTAVAETAMENSLSPETMMRFGLVGVAEAGEIAPAGTLDNIRGALDSAFLGVGDVFAQACVELQQHKQQSLTA